MVVNRDGHRFIAEDASYAISGYAINEQPEMRCFAIFDEPAMLEACADENVVRHYINDPGSDSWRIAAIRKNVDTGRVKVADSIEELARRSDISPAGLAASVKRYNRYADQGEDPEFFKKARRIYPIRTGSLLRCRDPSVGHRLVPCRAGHRRSRPRARPIWRADRGPLRRRRGARLHAGTALHRRRHRYRECADLRAARRQDGRAGQRRPHEQVNHRRQHEDRHHRRGQHRRHAARKFSAAGHQVSLANSRGPESIRSGREGGRRDCGLAWRTR